MLFWGEKSMGEEIAEKLDKIIDLLEKIEDWCDEIATK